MRILQFALIYIQVKIRQVFLVSYAIIKNKISFYPEFVIQFEKKYAEFCNKKYALSFCNGTSAIEASLFAIGVRPGDEVIVPSCTFHASIDPICNAGAQPVFVDVRRDNLTICPEDLKTKINSKTKAIIVVHLFGIPADMEVIQQIAVERGVAILEDTSHAHGAVAQGKICGAWGRIGAFSLQGAKAIAAGEGGIVVTDNHEDHIKMSMWGHFNRHGEEFHKIKSEAFRYTGVGFKRRMAPLSSLLASVDLAAINKINKIMTTTAVNLDKVLKKVPGVLVPDIHKDSLRGGYYSGYPLSVASSLVPREAIIDALRGIGVKATGYPFESHHKLQIYTDLEFRESVLNGDSIKTSEVSQVKLKNTEELSKSLVLISRRHLVTLSNKKIKQVAAVIRAVIEENSERDSDES